MSTFCYWDCRNLADTIILFCYLTATITLVVLTFIRARITIRLRDRGLRILRIYILIILWGVIFSYQLIL